jgi:8-oxo-dGTP pyrophosphatase MutT (NUDIX family)
MRSQRAIRLLPAVLTLLLSACASSTAPPCRYTGTPQYAPSAGCLTVVHGRILVVESAYGGVTPPGGKARAGEPAQCAARRETLEETGLDLIPGQLLRVFDTGFHLYSCDIHAESGVIEPGSPIEIQRALWLPVQDFDNIEWRFPGQGEELRKLLFGEQ